MENPNDAYQRELEQEELKKRKASTGLKVTVLIVLVVLLAVGILLPIKLVPNAVSSIANTITSIFIPNKAVKITVDKTVIDSGEMFTISWDGTHKTNGTYSLTYDCVQGLRLETSVNQPNDTIACGTPYYFSPNTNSIDLVAYSESHRYSDVKITLGFLENGATTLDTVSDKVVTITNPTIADNLASNTGSSTETNTTTSTTSTKTEGGTKVTHTPVTPKPTKPSQITYPQVQYGYPDLEVRPIAVGYINTQGAFIPSSYVMSNQQAAVKFAIVNVGTKNSGSFTFSADLPSDTNPHYSVGDQESLGPGDRIEYVLSFKNLSNVRDSYASIYVDQQNFVRESNEANNSAKMHIVNGGIAGTNYGRADLSVRILDTGYVNRSTGTYYPTNSVSSADRVGVRFEVVNNGDVETGTWRFSANLPTSNYNANNYSSDNEPSLKQGEKFIFTLTFDNIRDIGYNTVSVTVDSANQVGESSESNNTASATIYRN